MRRSLERSNGVIGRISYFTSVFCACIYMLYNKQTPEKILELIFCKNLALLNSGTFRVRTSCSLPCC